jgi:hypothetical protein
MDTRAYVSKTNEIFKSRFVRKALAETSIPPIYHLLVQSAAGGGQNVPDPIAHREQAPILGGNSIGQIVRLAQKRLQTMNRLG